MCKHTLRHEFGWRDTINTGKDGIDFVLYSNLHKSAKIFSLLPQTAINTTINYKFSTHCFSFLKDKSLFTSLLCLVFTHSHHTNCDRQWPLRTISGSLPCSRTLSHVQKDSGIKLVNW